MARHHRSRPVRPFDPRLLSNRLDREWLHLRRRPEVLARVRRWRVTEEPFEDLDELLFIAGYGDDTSPAANAVLRRLVEVARRDELAARIVLQRLLPGLLAVVRRRRDERHPEVAFDELLGATYLAMHGYHTGRRPDRVASNLVRDAGYRAFTAPRRRLSWTEISIDPHTLDETPAVIVVSAFEELAGLVADAREAGVDQADLDLLRELINVGSPTAVAAKRKVTTRTIRNHRDRTAGKLRDVAFAA